MSRTVALLTLAHGRSGDKGDAVNVGVIARRREWYPFLRETVTADRVATFLASLAEGPVERFEMENLGALNFLVHGALGGGGSVALQLDAQGKTYAHAALRLPIELPDALFAEAMEHWGGEIPRECFEAAPADPAPKGLVAVRRTGRVTTLTLNRPDKHNALTMDLLREAAAAVREVAADPLTKVLIVAGAGKSFCAGLDLKELGADFTRDRVHALAMQLADTLIALLEVPQPVVAAVHGAAVGGGTAIALAADVIVAHATSARFGFPEVRIGFVPGMVSTMAMRRLGPAHARETMLSGRTIDASEAHRHGWVHFLAGDPAPESALVAAEEYAAELAAKNSDAAMRRTKRLVAAGERAGLAADLVAAVDTFVAAALDEPFRRGVEAFCRRAPLDWSAL